MLDELELLSKQHYVSPHHRFWIHLGLGDRETAMIDLQAVYEDRTNSLPFFNILPLMESMRSEPVMKEIVRKMKLP
jgi:hypothetical protein